MRKIGKVVEVKIMSLFLCLVWYRFDWYLPPRCALVHVSLNANSQLIVETTPINVCEKHCCCCCCFWAAKYSWRWKGWIVNESNSFDSTHSTKMWFLESCHSAVTSEQSSTVWAQSPDKRFVSISAGFRCMLTCTVLHSSQAVPSRTKWYAMLCDFFFSVDSGIPLIRCSPLIRSRFFTYGWRTDAFKHTSWPTLHAAVHPSEMSSVWCRGSSPSAVRRPPSAVRRPPSAVRAACCDEAKSCKLVFASCFLRYYVCFIICYVHGCSCAPVAPKRLIRLRLFFPLQLQLHLVKLNQATEQIIIPVAVSLLELESY